MRIVENDPPDGEVQLAGRVLPIEIVEAFEEGRQPDKEFKSGKPKHPATISEWDKELSEIRDAIQRAVNKKEDLANYSQGTILVVYLNIGNDYRIAPPHVVQDIRAVCNRFHNSMQFALFGAIGFFGPAHIVNGGQVHIDWNLIED